MGSTVRTVLVSAVLGLGACAVPAYLMPSSSTPAYAADCATACRPIASCRPDAPALHNECLSACTQGDNDPETRNAMASLTCPQVDALVAEADGPPKPVVHERPTVSSGSTFSFHYSSTESSVNGQTESNETYEQHGTPPTDSAEARVPRVQIESIDVVVSPVRPDGTSWDGQRRLDDERAERLDAALASRDALRRTLVLLTSADFAAFDPPDLTGTVRLERGARTLGEQPLERLNDAFIAQVETTFDPARFPGGETLHVTIVDHDSRRDDAIADLTLSRHEILQALRKGGETTIDTRERSEGAVLFVTIRAREI